MTDQIADPFAVPVDEDDPFATPEDSQGGSFEPSPFLDALGGRLIALIPRKFEPEAKKRADRVEAGAPDTEERYTADMVVLGSAPVTFWGPGPKDKDGNRGEPVEITVPCPHLFTGTWRTEGRVVGRLKKIDGGARPILLGYVRRTPQAADRKKGVTTEQVETAYAAWEKRGKNGPRPKFSWDVVPDGCGPDEYAAARAWLKSAQAEGFVL